MARLYGMASWFPVSLAMVLATVAVLAVPQYAFADGGCGCQDGDDACLQCCSNCGDDPVCAQGCATIEVSVSTDPPSCSPYNLSCASFMEAQCSPGPQCGMPGCGCNWLPGPPNNEYSCLCAATK